MFRINTDFRVNTTKQSPCAGVIYISTTRWTS